MAGYIDYMVSDLDELKRLAEADMSVVVDDDGAAWTSLDGAWVHPAWDMGAWESGPLWVVRGPLQLVWSTERVWSER